MNKKANSALVAVLIVLAIIGAVVGIIYFTNSPQVIVNTDGTLTIHCYDMDGNPMSCGSQTFSTINGAVGVGSITMTFKATSTGQVPLSCYVTNPLVNGNSNGVFTAVVAPLASPSKNLPVGGTTEWTTSQLVLSSFETTGPATNFSAVIRCSQVGVGGPLPPLPDQTPFILLTILSDGTGSYTVGIAPPEGIPTDYCGDGECTGSIGETINTCAVDCTPPYSVFFRTIDLAYPFGSSIAYGTTCGSTLTKYASTSLSCWSQTAADCSTLTNTGYTRQLVGKTIPDNMPSWASTTPPCLFSSSSGLTLTVKVASLSGQPILPACDVGKWIGFNYVVNTGAPVSSSPTGFNILKEVQCP